MARKLLVLLALAVIGVIVAYPLLRGQFNWALFFSTLQTLDPWWLTASVVVTLVTYVIRAYRWQVLLTPLKVIGIQPLLSTTLIGFSAIYVLGRWGELARPLWLTRREHIPLSSSVATIIVERFLDFIMLIALFAIALLTVQVSPDSGPTLARMKDGAWWVTAASVAGIVGFFLFRSNIDRILPYVPFAGLRSMVAAFAQGLSFLQSGRSLGLAVFHSATLWIAIMLQFWFTLLGMHFSLSAEASTLVMVGTALGSIVQVPGIGGGFQAGFVFCMTTFFGVATETALAAALIAWVFSYAPTIVATVCYMIAQGVRLRDLKALLNGPEPEPGTLL
jgi:glycosyltransferase 2 family protein